MKAYASGRRNFQRALFSLNGRKAEGFRICVKTMERVCLLHRRAKRVLTKLGARPRPPKRRLPSQHSRFVDEAAFGKARQVEGAGVNQVGLAMQDQICQNPASGGVSASRHVR